MWSERTRLGKELSGALVATLAEVDVVFKFILPLAIPMLLLSANIFRILRETGHLLKAFLLGTVTTVIASWAAMALFPLRALGEEGWKIAAALTARHIGGAVNYMVYGAMMSVGLSAVICYIGTQVAVTWGMPTQSITVITGLTLLLATLLPGQLAPLAASGEGLALMLMQVFFAAVGASANVGLVVSTAPVLFCYSFIALAGHLGLMLGLGKLLGFSRRDLLLASNANIGGPSTVAGMAATKGWRSLIVPAILTSTLGYALGTFIGMALGFHVLKPLCS
eukprot:gene3199-3476_t